MEFLTTFRSRNDAIGWAKYLKSNGVAAKTVNKPSGLSGSCGLAVKSAVEQDRFTYLRSQYQGRVGTTYIILRDKGITKFSQFN
ncbi:MAG: DUF3343 domain-containing protein [Clostridia bacterium]|nr:DUF3343 domain-containing protein [Clostridia bacterium]MDY4083592.1 putative Se/S carrier-like protein [Eubacteriales bacterium]